MVAHECRHHRSTGTPGIPARNGFTAYLVLSPATNSSCHRHQRIKVCLSPVGPTRLRQLDTSNGCQDHTALPSAAIVVRLRAVDRSRAFRQPALRSRHTPNAAASTASHPASVTIAIRPSVGWDVEGYSFDLGLARRKISLKMGLDRQITSTLLICPTGRSRLLLDDNVVPLIGAPSSQQKPTDYFISFAAWQLTGRS